MTSPFLLLETLRCLLNVEILEGVIMEESHTYDPDVRDPRIILNNPNVDTTSLEVSVRNQFFNSRWR